MVMLTTKVLNGVLVTLDGELTINTLEDLKDDLFGLLNSRNITIDLSQVTEFDGCALQLLHIFLTESQQMQRNLLFAPLPPRLLNAMQLLGFTIPNTVPVSTASLNSKENSHGSVQS